MARHVVSLAPGKTSILGLVTAPVDPRGEDSADRCGNADGESHPQIQTHFYLQLTYP